MQRANNFVANVYEAIQNDTIKGNFSDDGKNFIFPIVKTKDRKGNISTWQIYVRVFDLDADKYTKFNKKMLFPGGDIKSTYIGVVSVDNITHTGKTRKSEDTRILLGKNIGKKNETNPVSQAILHATSKYRDKVRKSETNLPDNIILPMLIKSLKDVKLNDDEYSNGIIIERKYDGIRALSYIQEDGNVTMYSRTGMQYTNFTEIENELKLLISANNNINKKLYIDGELYRHGHKLQDISGAVRGVGRLDRKLLKLIVFDCFYITSDGEIEHTGALDRKKILDKLFKDQSFKFIEKSSWIMINSTKEVDQLLVTYLQDGYEGVILRRPNLHYEQSINNYHSSNVLKVKPYNTAEFKITGFIEGQHGKDVRALIVTCEVNGTTFNSVPTGMTYEERYHIFKRFGNNHTTLMNKLSEEDDGLTIFEKYVKGKLATIQYSILSKLGVPNQPKFVNIRDDEIDVISILLKEL
jgi:ATP-dependent DNA ligase